MQPSDFNLNNVNHLVAIWLIIVLLAQSIFVWVQVVRSIHFELPVLERSDEPRGTWGFPQIIAVVVVATLVLLHLKLTADASTPTVATEKINSLQVAADLVIRGGLAILLIAILVCSDRPPAEYGLKVQSFLTQVRDGVNGYLLALLPTTALLLLTSPFRNKETQNALLTLLSDSPDLLTVLLIAVAAVVVAPLYEEMAFRVVLQGWLTSLVGARVAIPIAAVIFAAIHGMTDGIALVPLAAILGIVFDRRHSYVSVLVIHGLFNATMLTLALLTQR